MSETATALPIATAGAPAADAAADYSLSDEELLAAEAAPTAPAAAETAAPAAAEPKSAAEESAAAADETKAPAEETPAKLEEGIARDERLLAPELREFFKANPKLAPYADRIYRERAFSQVGTVAEFKGLKDKFATVEEADAALTKARDLDNVDFQFDSGTPETHRELIAGLYDRNAETARHLVQTAMRELPELDRDGYDEIANGIFDATVEQRGVSANVATLIEALFNQEMPDREYAAKRAAEELRESLPGITEGRSSRPIRRGANGGATRQETARAVDVTREGSQQTEFQQKLGVRFLQEARNAFGDVVGPQINAKVAELMKDAPAAARTKVAQDIAYELEQALLADTDLNQRGALRVKAVRQALGYRDDQVQEHAKLIIARAQRALPAITKRVIEHWAGILVGSSKARAAKAAPTGATDVGRGGAPGTVKTAPKKVDYRTMSDEDILNSTDL
jgi:hypothetical protein